MIEKFLIIFFSRVNRPFKFYPFNHCFEFLFFDHSAEGCKYGNAQIEVSLGSLKFVKGVRKDFKLQARFDDMKPFFDVEKSGFNFPFDIKYNVCCYRSDGSNESEEDNELKESAETEETFEFIDESPLATADNRSIEDEAETSRICDEPEIGEDHSVDEQSEIELLESEAEKTLDAEVLNPDSKKVLQKLMITSGCNNVLMEEFEPFLASIEGRKIIMNKIATGINIDNFYEVLDCAFFFDSKEMKTFVIEKFMATYDTKTIINSVGFAKLKADADLLKKTTELFADAFTNKRISSPIIFFLNKLKSLEEM